MQIVKNTTILFDPNYHNLTVFCYDLFIIRHIIM